jgi:hypothetical protein
MARLGADLASGQIASRNQTMRDAHQWQSSPIPPAPIRHELTVHANYNCIFIRTRDNLGQMRKYDLAFSSAKPRY